MAGVNLETELKKRSHPTDACACRILNLAVPSDQRTLEALLEEGGVVTVHDDITSQLADLVATREPISVSSPADETAERIRGIVAGLPLPSYGRWVHYPWSQRLVHVLPQDEYRELRTDRNRYKITPSEQEILRSKKVKASLAFPWGRPRRSRWHSKGSAAPFASPTSTSCPQGQNLNRLRTGVQNLGVNKAILAAREILELDPYAHVVPFTKGVDETNIDAFLLGDKKGDDKSWRQARSAGGRNATTSM